MAKRKLYNDVANRMLAAVRELNAALVEAHEHPQVRVHMRLPTNECPPAQYGCEITRITKHEIPPEGDAIKGWRLTNKTFWKTDAPKKPEKSKKAKKAKKSPARKATYPPRRAPP